MENRKVRWGIIGTAEKPFADGIEEAIDACKENGVQFMDGTMWLHSNRTQALEKHITNGDIGDVKRVTSGFTFKAPNKEWYEGGNGRTDKTREPMGCFGDQGWYPVGDAGLIRVDDLVERFSSNLLAGELEDEWPKRTVACHRVMSALFKSAESGSTVVSL